MIVAGCVSRFLRLWLGVDPHLKSEMWGTRHPGLWPKVKA
jgi:hypothetical protein